MSSIPNLSLSSLVGKIKIYRHLSIVGPWNLVPGSNLGSIQITTKYWLNTSNNMHFRQHLPSVLWRCWLGGRKGMPVKNWVVGYSHGYVPGASCRLAYGPADTVLCWQVTASCCFKTNCQSRRSLRHAALMRASSTGVCQAQPWRISRYVATIEVYIYTTSTTPVFTPLFQYQQGKTCLDLNEARGDGVSGSSVISWTICKQSAPRFRHFYRPGPLLDAQPTVS